MERAYDCMWRHGILRKLSALRGKLRGMVISNFVIKRYFRVNLVLSDRYGQQSGIAQGSEISIALLAVFINGIALTPPPSTHYALFVGDFTIWVAASTTAAPQIRLQLGLDRLQQLSTRNGFNVFSKKPSVCFFV